MAGRYCSPGVLVAPKGACWGASSPPARRAWSTSWRRCCGGSAGSGPAWAGPTGVARSYQEAVQALELSARLELDTLATYFQTGGVAAETARRLHLGPAR